MAERSAVLIIQRPRVGNVVGHAKDIATNELGMLAQVGVGDDQRVLDDLLGRTREQAVEAAIDGDVGHDRDQNRRQHRDH